jgi:hypothetical protein
LEDKIKQLDLQRWNLETRILATIAYFDVFEKGLSLEEFDRLVLGGKASPTELKLCLNKLTGEVVEFGGRYFLKESVPKAINSGEYADEIRKKARKLIEVLRHLPFLKLVSICNYSSFGIADEHSDIDLFVISQKDRIFLAKMFLTVCLHFLGLRRHGKKIRGRFCLSFYTDENCLNMEDILIAKDIYFAYWFLALEPIYGEKIVWENLFKMNKEWLGNYFDKIKLPEADFRMNKSFLAKFWEYILAGKLGNYLERKLEEFFIDRYEKQKACFSSNASIIVSKNRLKYHNNDRREFFRDQWVERLEWLGISE